MFIPLPKRIARRFGIELKRYSKFRQAVDALVSDEKKPFFVQIGANNGIDFDDLYWAVVENSLSGMVIEPVSDYFASLEHAYARQPEVVPVRAAIHPTAERMKMYRVKADKVTQKWQHGLASFDRQLLAARHQIPEEAIIEEDVACISLTSLMERVPENIDILAIDTEGFDSEILKMVDFARVSPSIIRFEAKHMPHDDLRHWTGFLKGRGYSVRISDLDCLAVRR